MCLNSCESTYSIILHAWQKGVQNDARFTWYFNITMFFTYLQYLDVYEANVD